MKKITWRPLWSIEKGYNASLRAAAIGQNGCYAVRDYKKVILYVGESHTGRLWRTMLRHFQGMESGKFEARNEWVWSDRETVQVQLWITRTGAEAMDLEVSLIQRLNPTQESLSYFPDFDLLMGRPRSTEENEPAPF